MFTGDRSGDWLFRAMHRVGLASQPTSTDRDDGLTLSGAWVTASARCAPPGNRPTPSELGTCRPWLARELELLTATLRVVICLGQIGYTSLWRVLSDHSEGSMPRPRPRFGHGVEIAVPGDLTVICSYHPSQQNTFTGRLTEAMFDEVFDRAVRIASDVVDY